MRVPWTARRTNLSILKEIKPECSLEGQILKLRLKNWIKPQKLTLQAIQQSLKCHNVFNFLFLLLGFIYLVMVAQANIATTLKT